jgi:hypothetical protein
MSLTKSQSTVLKAVLSEYGALVDVGIALELHNAAVMRARRPKLQALIFSEDDILEYARRKASSVVTGAMAMADSADWVVEGRLVRYAAPPRGRF